MKRMACFSSLLAIAIALPAMGCPSVFRAYSVRRHFLVTVSGNSGKPLSGIEVKIVRFIVTENTQGAHESIENAAEALTDVNGQAIFNLTPGDYRLSTTLNGLQGGGGNLRVAKSGYRVPRLKLFWPAGIAIRARTVSGTLVVAGERPALSGAEISLAQPMGEVIGKTSTDSRGRFAFSNVNPGLYVIRIQSDAIKGHMLIQVDPRAKDPTLPSFRLFMAKCGLAAYKSDGSMIFFEVG